MNNGNALSLDNDSNILLNYTSNINNKPNNKSFVSPNSSNTKLQSIHINNNNHFSEYGKIDNFASSKKLQDILKLNEKNDKKECITSRQKETSIKSNTNTENTSNSKKYLLNSEFSDKYPFSRMNNRKNTKNSTKNQKIYLLSQVKKILKEFEKDHKPPKKINKKKKTQLTKEIDKNKNNINDSSRKKMIDLELLLRQRNLHPIVPKVKTQIQLNHYLINDFKESEANQAYIRRSMKYQEMNDDFEEILEQLKEKRFLQNNVNTSVNNNEQEKETPSDEDDFYYYEKINDTNIDNINNAKTVKKKSTPFITMSNEKINDFNNSLRQVLINSKNSDNNSIKSYHFKEPNSNPNEDLKEKSRKKVKIKTQVSADVTYNQAPTGIKYLRCLHNNKAIRNSKNKTSQKQIFDKFEIASNLYKEHKKEYTNYLIKKQIMRGKNYSKQMALLEKEKEYYKKIDGNDEDEEYNSGKVFKLNQNELLHQMRLKYIFTNSFNTMRLFNEGDQDLDIDDPKKLKELCIDTQIKMVRALKSQNNPNYIKNKFSKTTVGQYQRSRGIFFCS